MAGLHVIIGEDDFLVAETAKKLVASAGDALEVIDSVNSSNAELQLADLCEADASFSTPPFLEPVKATWWKNVGFLPQGGKGGPSEDVKAALEKFAKKLAASPLPENQKFVLSGSRLLMTSIFAKTLKPVAEMVVFESSGKPWAAAKNATVRAIDFAQEAGFKFASGAAERFVAIVGNDTRSIMSEIGKLRDYLGGKKVATAADVDDIASQGVGVEPAIWDITDAIGERNLARAVAAVSRFEKENGFAVMVTGVIERFFRQLIELKDAQERGFAERATEGMNPFAARKNLGFVRNWTLRELRGARSRFLALRERAVSSSGSTDVLVLTELVRTVGKCRM